ncbi:12895_t:CDS:2 [Dentiscutata erythropus]|uniref:12895_t:CDS:1 n=1 Tax=Dentiscutata erythropus TaxID=1348616 RepID=A0A9N9GVC4_9GLOM|nr:12895_t:CDS:2 [Dentiscutata erythropus]
MPREVFPFNKSNNNEDGKSSRSLKRSHFEAEDNESDRKANNYSLDYDSLIQELASIIIKVGILKEKEHKLVEIELYLEEETKKNEVLQEYSSLAINKLNEERAVLERKVEALEKVDKKNEVFQKIVSKLEKEKENLEKQVETLERAVLELKDNLVAKDYAIWQNTLNRLKAKNKDLLLKLEELYNKLERIYTDGIDIDVIPIQSLKNAEHLNNLLEALQNRSEKYNEALSKLFGYNFEFYENKSVRLTLLFFDDSNYFIFKLDKNEKMQLAGGSPKFIESLENHSAF